MYVCLDEATVVLQSHGLMLVLHTCLIALEQQLSIVQLHMSDQEMMNGHEIVCMINSAIVSMSGGSDDLLNLESCVSAQDCLTAVEMHQMR